ncbi:nlpB/DapX lipofamily protein, partial [Vibrio parahaemolyticus V-223/04]
EVCISR